MAETSFGEQLRALRRTAGMTLEALAESSGVSVRAISDMERGHSRAPQDRTLAALLDGLGLAEADRAGLLRAARAARAQNSAERPQSGEPPRAVSDLVGREAELRLIAEHAAAATPGQPAPVVLVHGQAGLGKTALALHAVDQLRDRFPDGRCYVDLRGMDSTPMPVGEALRRLLQACGVDPGRIAGNEDEQAGQLRAVLAERRCLLLLDNAAGEAQVRPLLPGAGPAMAIVTSRRTLSGLEGILRLGLAPLADAEATGLLRAVGGTPSRTATDDEVGAVARLCGNLPLALRIAGTRFATRPGWTMRHLIDRLTDEERRLANLATGDTGVAAAFALSYTQLTEPAATLFRRLALVPGTDFAAPLAAALLDVDRYDAEDLLDDLFDLGLLQPAGVGRYRFHDLIRLYAAERLHADEPAPERDHARRSLLDALIDTAITAGRWWEPDYGTPPPHWRGLDPLDGHDTARTWLRTEQSNWLGALHAIAEDGQHQRVVDVAEAMHWYSETSHQDGPWSDVYRLSRAAAARLPDRRQELTHINYLAWVVVYLEHRSAEGAVLAMEARDIAVEIGDAKGEAEALWLAGTSWAKVGEHDRALAAHLQALEVADAIGAHDAYVQYVGSLGSAYHSAGLMDEAAAQYRRVVQEAEQRPLSETPRRSALANAYNGLLFTLAGRQRWTELLAEAPAAVAANESNGNASSLALVLLQIGRAHLALGDHPAARAALTRAADLYRSSVAQPDKDRVDQVHAALAAIDAAEGTAPAPP